MADTLSENFLNPPVRFSPAPFWWWSGTDLDIEQLKWQLDQLVAKGVRRAIIGYSHFPDGSLDQSSPTLWSEEWWAIFLQVLDHARSIGTTIGLQDYIILNTALAQSGLPGATLHHQSEEVPANAALRIELPNGGQLLEATARRGGEVRNLASAADNRSVTWTSDSAGWTIHLVYSLATLFDPLALQAGAISLGAFQQKVADRIGDHLGTTFDTFFQDELDFHGRWPFWSDDIPQRFADMHGYELTGRLAELWHGDSARCVKLRLDFHDTAVGLLEDRYFKPVKAWHDQHSCLLGHDNAGRGAVGRGRDFYGDYMRTMRWYSAPGSDDPDLGGPRAFVGLKVASSIATAYGLPRVWAECFHSSGWGATTDALLAATNSVFALGANLINLHGLYASTCQSWWEWAPPDFHFRQPYWACLDEYNAYVARLSWLLSQGEKISDVAVLYPTIAIAGGLNAEVSPDGLQTAYSEQQRGEAIPPLDAAEVAAFKIAEALFEDGVDVDFIDDASVERADLEDGWLRVGNGRWHTVILPEMSAIRAETLERLAAFRAAGGRVIVIGASPVATNSDDLKGYDLEQLVAEATSEWFAPVDRLDLEWLRKVVPDLKRSMSGGRLQILRRRVEGDEIYLLHNAADEPFAGELSLAGGGNATLLDSFAGSECILPCAPLAADRVSVSLEIEPRRLVILRLRDTAVGVPGRRMATESPAKRERRIPLAGPWRYSLVPTMDNRHRDFASSAAIVGLEVSRMRWREDPRDAWSMIAPTYAPRFSVLGPVPQSADLEGWIATVARTPIDQPPPQWNIGPTKLDWQEKLVSPCDGILDDPWLKSWESGPHGLKNRTPDEYIDCGIGDCAASYVVTGVISAAAPAVAVASQAAYTFWIAGKLVARQAQALVPQTTGPWHLPSYEAPHLTVPVEPNREQRFVLCLDQPNGQRIRAYVGVDDASTSPGVRAQRLLADNRFKIAPVLRQSEKPQYYAIEVPPGATSLTLKHRGRLSASRNGHPLSHSTTPIEDGWALSEITGGSAAAPSEPVELRLEETGGARAGDAISVISVVEPSGPITLGDWCQQGLGSYSGGVRYSTSFDLPEGAKTVHLDLDDVAVCCVVTVNGRFAGKLIGRPWVLDITEQSHSGPNALEVVVYNTLANHFAHFTPSPFARDEQTRSGLIGQPAIYAEIDAALSGES